MKRKKQAREWLYLRYKKEHQEAEERMEIAQSLGTEPEKVVVRKVSFASKLLDSLLDVGYQILRIGFWLIVFGLASIGLTILINERLRNTVWDMIKVYF